MSDDKHDYLRDSEVAIIDAIKSLMEVMMTIGIAEPLTFDRLFTHQRDHYMTKGKPNAAAVMILLLQFANDPQRQAHRETLRKTLREPPQGSA